MFSLKQSPHPADEDCTVDEHFSKAELAKIGPFEMRTYLNMKRNYLMLLSMGLPVARPLFMQGPGARKRRIQRLQAQSDSDSDEEWTPVQKVKKKDSAYKAPFKFPLQPAKPKVPKPSDGKLKDSKLIRKKKESVKPDPDRYSKRSRPITNFMDIEVPDDDCFLYCEECNKEYDSDCPVHGALHSIEDKQILAGNSKGTVKAEASLPECLQIKTSSIPSAGLGVFATTTIPHRSRFGPYVGLIIKDADEAHSTGYSWQIYKDGKAAHFVDASDPKKSNWMRYVNCARSEQEQNLTAYQYEGGVYYRSHCTIQEGQELLVWYGAEYGTELGISRRVASTAKISNGGAYTVISKSGETLFACELCLDIQFVYEKYLRTHMKYKHQVTLPLDWKDTNGNSPVKKDTQNHKKPKDKDWINKTKTSPVRKKLQNLEKSKGSENIQNINGTNTKSHTEKPFQCTMCEFRCAQKSDLTRHMLTHTGEKPLQCTMCEYRCALKDHLTRHMLTHTGEKPFQCTMCEYRCTVKSHLTRHMLTHTGEKPFQCTMCEYRCARKGDLTKHMLAHTGEKPFQCTMCEYRCTMKGDLTNHIRTHTGEKPFQCTMCEYRCTQKNNLTTHMLTHTGEKPFQCTMCEYRCTQKGHLTDHMLTHTGEKPFQCTMCEYRCTVKSNLTKHMLTHTGEKPFQCTMCEYRCTVKSNLTKHMLTHTGEKPFQCTMCEYRCTVKSNLTTHMKTHKDYSQQKANVKCSKSQSKLNDKTLFINNRNDQSTEE